MFKQISTSIILVLPLLASLSIPASAAEVTSVLGYAYVANQHPISNGTVRLLDLKRKPLNCDSQDGSLRCTTKTGPKGTFTLYAKNLPNRFIIEVEGGTLPAGSLTIALRAIVDSKDVSEIIHVNPLSNLIAESLKKHPKRGHSRAENRVKQIFGLPSEISLKRHLRTTSAHLHAEKLFEHVEKKGSWHRWTQAISRRMRRRVKKDKKVSLGIETDYRENTRGAAGIIGGALLNGLLGKAKSCNPNSGPLGWLTGSIARTGLASKDPACKATDMFEKIAEQLEDIQGRLSKMETLMVNGFQELKVKLARQDLEGIAGEVDDIANVIDSHFEDLGHIANSVGDHSLTDAEREARAKEFLEGLKTDLKDSMWDQLNDKLYGTVLKRGLYRIYWDYGREKSPFIGPTDITAFNALTERYAYQLARYALLKSEYWHATPGFSTNEIASNLEDYQTDVERYDALLINTLKVPSDVAEKDQISYYDPFTNLLWARYSILNDKNNFSQADVIDKANSLGEGEESDGWIFPDEKQVLSLVKQVETGSPVNWLAPRMPLLMALNHNDLIKHIPYCSYWHEKNDTNETRLARPCVLTGQRKFSLQEFGVRFSTIPRFYPYSSKWQSNCGGGMSAYRLTESESTNLPFDTTWSKSNKKSIVFGYYRDRYGYSMTIFHYLSNKYLPSDHVATLRPKNENNVNDLQCGTNWAVMNSTKKGAGYGRAVIDSVPAILVVREVPEDATDERYVPDFPFQ